MTKGLGVVPMETYHLAQYAVQVPCYICEGGNTFDTETCRHCLAPMALAHQATSQGIKPQMLAVVGSAAAGKTVYLGMLTEMLSRRAGELELLARGAFSLQLQQMTIGALAGSRFPEKTPNEPDNWNWVHAQVRSKTRRRPVELVLPDIAGETIIEEIEHPNTFPVIAKLLEKCTGTLLLLDTPKVHAQETAQTFFAMKLINYLSSIHSRNKRSQKAFPLAIAFSKADQCESSFDDPDDFAQKHCPNVHKLCHSLYPRHKFFASAVVGRCGFQTEYSGGTVAVPLRTEPRGIVAPFQWLVEQLK